MYNSIIELFIYFHGRARHFDSHLVAVIFGPYGYRRPTELTAIDQPIERHKWTNRTSYLKPILLPIQIELIFLISANIQLLHLFGHAGLSCHHNNHIYTRATHRPDSAPASPLPNRTKQGRRRVTNTPHAERNVSRKAVPTAHPIMMSRPNVSDSPFRRCLGSPVE